MHMELESEQNKSIHKIDIFIFHKVDADMNKHLIIIQILLLPSFFIILSCKDLNKDYEYIGTWQYNEKITSNEIVYNTSRTIKLTKDSYEETYLIQRENPGTISAITGTRGIITINHSNITFHLRDLGKCITDGSGFCTQEVEWFGQGTDYFSNNIKYFKEEVSGEFEVTGNSMRLIRDLNNDGDTDDIGEDVTFTML